VGVEHVLSVPTHSHIITSRFLDCLKISYTQQKILIVITNKGFVSIDDMTYHHFFYVTLALNTIICEL
jgi:hypothetical protein